MAKSFLNFSAFQTNFCSIKKLVHSKLKIAKSKFSYDILFCWAPNLFCGKQCDFLPQKTSTQALFDVLVLLEVASNRSVGKFYAVIFTRLFFHQVSEVGAYCNLKAWLSQYLVFLFSIGKKNPSCIKRCVASFTEFYVYNTCIYPVFKTLKTANQHIR